MKIEIESEELEALMAQSESLTHKLEQLLLKATEGPVKIRYGSIEVIGKGREYLVWFQQGEGHLTCDPDYRGPYKTLAKARVEARKLAKKEKLELVKKPDLS